MSIHYTSYVVVIMKRAPVQHLPNLAKNNNKEQFRQDQLTTLFLLDLLTTYIQRTDKQRLGPIINLHGGGDVIDRAKKPGLAALFCLIVRLWHQPKPTDEATSKRRRRRRDHQHSQMFDSFSVKERSLDQLYRTQLRGFFSTTRLHLF